MTANALLNAFPTVSSFLDFKESDRDISRRAIPGILKYAFQHAVIDTHSEEAFIAFLTKNGKTDSSSRLPQNLTFSDVLNTLSGNLSVNALIAQVEVTARELSLPGLQASMITRLKKKFVINTPKKRALLRILAFKLGQKHPDLNWNYELLLQLPALDNHQPETVRDAAGITVMFHLTGHGAVIPPTDVAWLKNELAACIDYLKLESHIHRKVIETIGATSFTIRAPKKPGPQEEPRLYNDAIRNVMAIAHQMSTRWLLSGYGTPRKKTVIIVHAGGFNEAGAAFQRILDIPLHNESGIYLNDFAHLCALYASVKAGFEHYTPEASRGFFDTGQLWSVHNFLSHGYYDFIPCLLDGKMLPRSIEDPSYKDFRQALHFPEQAGYCSFGAIAAIHRFPQSALMLTEIAKALRARQMLFEADTVLANLLLSSPRNLAARLMRMLIYQNIAQSQSESSSARLAFERAEAEGDFIVACCEPESDIWHEIGVLHFSQAINYFKFFRRGNPAGKAREQMNNVQKHLSTAKNAFLKSMTVSPTGKALNSLYMFGYTLCLMELLSAKKSFTGKLSGMPRENIRSIFRNVSMRIFRNIGWLDDESTADTAKRGKSLQDLFLTINLFIARYENLVLCRSNIPHMKYMFAMILWDFAPGLSLELCRITLAWLKAARKEAEKLHQDNVCIYHAAFGSISVEQFLAHVQDTINMIRRHIPEEDLRQDNESAQIKSRLKQLSGVKLMLLELDRLHAEPTTIGPLR